MPLQMQGILRPVKLQGVSARGLYHVHWFLLEILPPQQCYTYGLNSLRTSLRADKAERGASVYISQEAHHVFFSHRNYSAVDSLSFPHPISTFSSTAPRIAGDDCSRAAYSEGGGELASMGWCSELRREGAPKAWRAPLHGRPLEGAACSPPWEAARGRGVLPSMGGCS
jgi:hypothetical protein